MEFAKIPEAASGVQRLARRRCGRRIFAQLQDPSGGDFKKFAAVAQEFVERAKKEPAIGQVGTNFRVSAPRLYANVNRERAKALGVPISDILTRCKPISGHLHQ